MPARGRRVPPANEDRFYMHVEGTLLCIQTHRGGRHYNGVRRFLNQGLYDSLWLYTWNLALGFHKRNSGQIRVELCLHLWRYSANSSKEHDQIQIFDCNSHTESSRESYHVLHDGQAGESFLCCCCICVRCTHRNQACKYQLKVVTLAWMPGGKPDVYGVHHTRQCFTDAGIFGLAYHKIWQTL